MFAFAVSRETRPSEICVKIYQKTGKNILIVIDRNAKYDCQIVIIFGTDIFDTTAIK